MQSCRFPLILLFLVVSFAAWSAAEEVRVTSTFDKRSAQVGEEIHLTIRITGAQGNIQAPQLPHFKEIDTFYTGRASNITFINGESSSSVEFSYSLVPREPGKFTLDPIQVSVGSQVFRTDPVEIEVSGSSVQTSPAPSAPSLPSFPAGSSGAPLQEPPPAFKPEDDNIFIRAWIDKTSVYPNEQVLLTYSLYTRYDTRYEGFEEEPQTSGFWIEKFPADREIAKETVRVDGKRYVKADVHQIALFPTAPAEYTIQPGTLKVSIRQEPQSTSIFDEFFNDSFFSGGSFFSRRENRILKPPPLALVVKPFPKAGQPEGFQGVAGQFQIAAAIDKDSVKQNEPVTMKMVIEGQGNIETLNKPKIPELPGFKIYDGDTSSQLFKSGTVIGGRRNFEIVFIPMREGNFKIPKLEFSYFNPALASYVTLNTPEFNLHVAKSEQVFELPKSLSQDALFKKEVRLEGRDIHYIHEKLPEVTGGAVFSLVTKGLFAADGILILLVLFGLWRDYQEQLFARDQPLRRRRQARSSAESRIRRLKRLERSPDGKAAQEYFEEVEKTLSQYLSDKFNLSTYGMTRDDLAGQLENILNTDDPLRREIDELYRLCEESRFARADIPQELKAKALKILRDTISRVEKRR